MPLLNDFMLGADPEFVVIDGGHVKRWVGSVPAYSPWGIDHGGFVLEPHPKPDPCVRTLVQNLKVALNDFAVVAPEGKWRAGAYLVAPERTITLGGHVHIDKPTYSGAQLGALDLFTQHLEQLDILPTTECKSRRDQGHYGHYSDVRVEHGHFEYRTFPSWLFSQRVTKICLTGTKLAVVDPAAPSEELGSVKQASLGKLKKFFERFKSKDDDASWVLSTNMLDKKLVIDPSKDLRSVWNVKPVKEDPHWKRTQQGLQTTAAVPDVTTRLVRNTVAGWDYRWRVPVDHEMTADDFRAMREAIVGGEPYGRVIRVAGVPLQFFGRVG